MTRGSIAAGAFVLATAACSSSGSTSAVPINSPHPLPTCPAAKVSPAVWPATVPDSLPKPPGSVLTSQSTTQGVTYVHFTTASSLREGVIFVVTQLRKAGYVLGRGDAELNEADAPFGGPTVVGALRLTRVMPCQTSWVLAIVPRSGAQLPTTTLIPHSPVPGASPLPFG